MNVTTTLLILTLGLAPLTAFPQAQTSASYRAEKHAEEIKQLRRSVDSLLQALTDAARQEGQQSLSRKVTSEVQQLNRQSEQLAAQGSLEEARQPLNRALIKIKIAINALKGTPSQSAPLQSNGSPGLEQETEQESASEFVIGKRKEDIVKQKSSIDALMQALTRIGEEKQQQGMVQEIYSQVTAWGQQSDKLAEQGKLVQARRLLDQSLVEIKTAIGSLRESETLVRSLNFATKQEEYAYEVDRFDTYQMLLQMLVLPKQEITGSQRTQIEQWAEKARQQRTEAGNQATQGHYKEAVETLEAAGRTLLKAIRRGGVYLPG